MGGVGEGGGGVWGGGSLQHWILEKVVFQVNKAEILGIPLGNLNYSRLLAVLPYIHRISTARKEKAGSRLVFSLIEPN